MPFKVAVHAPLDAVESRAHTAPEGDPCADDGNDGGELGEKGGHKVMVVEVEREAKNMAYRAPRRGCTRVTLTPSSLKQPTTLYL